MPQIGTLRICRLESGEEFVEACYAGYPCGCRIAGSGTCQEPFRIEYCQRHAAMRDLPQQEPAAPAGPQEGDLRVWWVRNPPSPAEHHPVPDLVAGMARLKRLADHDLRSSSVESNAGGLEVFEDGEWTEWYDDEGRGIDDLVEATPSLASECSARVGGHAWDDPEDTDEAPTSYCEACGMQGRDYLALKRLEARIAAFEKVVALIEPARKATGQFIIHLGGPNRNADQYWDLRTAAEEANGKLTEAIAGLEATP